MDESKFNVSLDIRDENFIQDLKKALGLKPGEILEISTPQFERTDGRQITYLPNTPEEYAALPYLEPENLKKIGCQIWESEGGKVHWLFPAEWYEHIPAGTKIIDISGQVEEFHAGETDNDRRSGCLAYGFIQIVH